MEGKMEELVIYGIPKWGTRRRKVNIPEPGPKEVLIKVVAAGLNQKDWKYTEDLDVASAFNAGDDLTGTVAAVGSSVSEFSFGDRVAAFHRLNAPSGAYAEYAIAPAATTFHLPPAISFEAGATLPLAAMTAAIALYPALGLPMPWVPASQNVPVLIYGGASGVGAFALQFAKLSGLNPIITVAGQGVEFVRSLDAATHVIDYRMGDATYVQSEILRALDGQLLLHAFDCVGINGSWDIAGSVLAPGGRIEMIDWGKVLDWDSVNDAPGPNAWTPPIGVDLSFTLVSSAYGEKHDWITEGRAAADADFAYVFYRYLTKLLEEGRLKTHPHEVLPGGLDGVLKGIEDLQKGKVSAKKLVIRIADTTAETSMRPSDIF